LLAHRLVGALMAAMVRLLSEHGTVPVERLNWRDYNAASFAGRKGYETLLAIFISKFIMYLKTFLGRLKSELRADGKRREYDRKLFVAMENLEDSMHAQLSGNWRLSKLFVAVRTHKLVRAARSNPCHFSTPEFDSSVGAFFQCYLL
jgi:hypothetical protein